MNYRLMGDDDRAKYLVNNLSTEPTPHYMEFLREYWSGNYFCFGNPVIHNPLTFVIKHELVALIKNNADMFMGDDNKSTLDKLPETMTVYRGGDGFGYSWTLDKEYAKRFGLVFTMHINKKEVNAFLGDREENEIIILNAKQ